MNTFIKSIIVAVMLLLSGCYVHPAGGRYGVVGVRSNSYNNGYYSNGYYNPNSYYNGWGWSGYRNVYPNRNQKWRGNEHHNNGGYHNGRSGFQSAPANRSNLGWGEHHHNNGYNNGFGQQRWQGGFQFGNHGRH